MFAVPDLPLEHWQQTVDAARLREWPHDEQFLAASVLREALAADCLTEAEVTQTLEAREWGFALGQQVYRAQQRLLDHLGLDTQETDWMVGRDAHGFSLNLCWEAMVAGVLHLENGERRHGPGYIEDVLELERLGRQFLGIGFLDARDMPDMVMPFQDESVEYLIENTPDLQPLTRESLERLGQTLDAATAVQWQETLEVEDLQEDPVATVIEVLRQHLDRKRMARGEFRAPELRERMQKGLTGTQALGSRQEAETALADARARVTGRASPFRDTLLTLIERLSQSVIAGDWTGTLMQALDEDENGAPPLSETVLMVANDDERVIAGPLFESYGNGLLETGESSAQIVLEIGERSESLAWAGALVARGQAWLQAVSALMDPADRVF